MLGDSRSVAKLLLPAGATVLDVEQITVEQPPRDTGTVLGVIQRDPVNYYRCGVAALFVASSAVALFGVLLLLPLRLLRLLLPRLVLLEYSACCPLPVTHVCPPCKVSKQFCIPRHTGFPPCCSYEVLLADRTHLQMTAAAQLGQLYVLGASVPDSQWAECGAGLKEAARSFRLRYRWM